MSMDKTNETLLQEMLDDIADQLESQKPNIIIVSNITVNTYNVILNTAIKLKQQIIEDRARGISNIKMMTKPVKEQYEEEHYI
jgi:predicted Fe-Mo cluster-binding NifX family protein